MRSAGPRRSSTSPRNFVATNRNGLRSCAAITAERVASLRWLQDRCCGLRGDAADADRKSSKILRPRRRNSRRCAVHWLLGNTAPRLSPFHSVSNDDSGFVYPCRAHERAAVRGREVSVAPPQQKPSRGNRHPRHGADRLGSTSATQRGQSAGLLGDAALRHLDRAGQSQFRNSLERILEGAKERSRHEGSQSCAQHAGHPYCSGRMLGGRSVRTRQCTR